MKIAYLANSCIPSSSANSIHVMKMCQAFSELGHEVKLFVPDHDNKKSVDDIFDYYGVDRSFTVEYVPYYDIKGRAFWLGLSMAKKVSKFDPDFSIGRVLTGCFFTAQRGFRTFFEAHLPVKGSGKVYELLFNYAFKRKYFERLIVITNSLKNYFEEESGINKDFLVVAADGADKPDIDNLSKKELGESSAFKVGYVGHMYPGKGMEIISQLVVKCPDIEFHLVGGKGEELRYWKEQLNDFENVNFYGFVPHSETTSYMISVDVLVAPYLQKVQSYGGESNLAEWTSPLKLFEYMSVKKPIISSDLPVLKEVLKHNKNALLCSPQDIDEWKYALERLVKDKNLRKELSEQAYRDFIENYTWESRVKHILSHI